MRRYLMGCGFLFSSFLAAFAPRASAQPGLTVQIVEGDGAINSIRMRRGHDPVVRVLDPKGEPISAASVTFVLPAAGPGGTFGDSGLSITTQTDARGLAAGHGLRPNTIAGQFRIRVAASWRGEAGSASIAQTNAEPVVKSGRGKKIAILVVVAAAIAGGAAAAASAGKSSPAPGGATGGTQSAGSITAGSPALGPPH